MPPRLRLRRRPRRPVAATRRHGRAGGARAIRVPRAIQVRRRTRATGPRAGEAGIRILRQDCPGGNCDGEVRRPRGTAHRLLRHRAHPRGLYTTPSALCRSRTTARVQVVAACVQGAACATPAGASIRLADCRHHWNSLAGTGAARLTIVAAEGEGGLALTLVIGNKNYSSWSFRPWIAMKAAGIAFDEVVISLDAQDFKTRVSQISGTGKVPALADGHIHVWESLAILEYLAEKFPAAKLVAVRPGGARACPGGRLGDARGFHAAAPGVPDELLAAGEEARARRRGCGQRPAHRALWTDCRTRFGAAGRSCSAPSGRPTRCTRRWYRASTPMASRSVRPAARLHGGGHGAAGLGANGGRRR